MITIRGIAPGSRRRRELARRARAKLEAEAWIKGAYEAELLTGGTGYCAIGALAAVIRESQHSHALRYDLFEDDAIITRVLHKCAYERGYSSAFALNDAPETERPDVLALYDNAIKKL